MTSLLDKIKFGLGEMADAPYNAIKAVAERTSGTHMVDQGLDPTTLRYPLYKRYLPERTPMVAPWGEPQPQAGRYQRLRQTNEAFHQNFLSPPKLMQLLVSQARQQPVNQAPVSRFLQPAEYAANGPHKGIRY